jgi:hypothetical protein
MQEFAYDSITLMEHNPSLLKFLHRFSKSEIDSQEKTLAIIFDDRSLLLYEKNFIKNLLEFFYIDCMKFTLKPSSGEILNNIVKGKSKFKYFCQLSFVLQSLDRYKINKAYISSKYLSLKPNEEGYVDAVLLYDSIVNWLQDSNNIIKGDRNFCSINYLEEFPRSNFEGKKIFYTEKVTNDVSDVIELEYNFEDQITPLEKDLFWVGFDNKFKEVPWEKPYEDTKWTEKLKDIPQGKGYYEDELQ